MSDEYKIKAVFSAIDNLTPTMNAVRGNLKTLDRAFSKLQSASGRLASKLALPLSVIAGAGILSIHKAVTGFVSLGDALDKTSRRAGVATNALQELQYAASLSGVENDQLEKGIVMLNKNLAAAATGGNKKLAEMMNHLGISMRDSSGNVRNASDVMYDLSEAMKNNTNAAARTQIATNAFGKAGASLIPMLANGADELYRMRQEAEKLGIVMSEQNIKNAVELKDTFTQFQRVARTVSSVIGAQLAPALTEVVKEMQAAILANRELIRARLKELVEKIAEAVKKIDWNKLITDLFQIIEICGKVIDALGGVKGIIMMIAGLKLAGLITDIVSFGTALYGVGTALATVVATVGAIPIMIGIAIAAAVATLWLIYDNWEEICDFVSARVQEVGDFFNKIWDDTASFFTDAWNKAIDWVMDKVSAFADIVQGVFDGIRDTWNSITGGSFPSVPNGGKTAGSVDVNIRTDRGSHARVTNQSGDVSTNIFGTVG